MFYGQGTSSFRFLYSIEDLVIIECDKNVREILAGNVLYHIECDFLKIFPYQNPTLSKI